MYETKIKNNVTYLEGVPSDKWTAEHWAKWQANTAELLAQCDRIMGKLQFIAQNWGKYGKNL